MSGELVHVPRQVDIVEQIDELAAEEKCWHCGRAFHELALTQKVDQMFTTGTLDPNYFAREDLSPIVCDGSTFIGPLRPEPPAPTFQSTYSGGGYLEGIIKYLGQTMQWPEMILPKPIIFDTTPWLQSLNSSWSFTKGASSISYWLDEWSTAPEKLKCDNLPEIDIQFGPQNWVTTERAQAPNILKSFVAHHYWADCIKQDIPTPERPGLDFSEYTNDSGPYWIANNKKAGILK